MSNEDYDRRRALGNHPRLVEKLRLSKEQAKPDGSDDRGAAGCEEESPSKFQWPDAMADEAFYGPAGEVVKLISPHSEADPAALLAQFLAGFGSLAGRHAYYVTDGARQYSNVNVVIVGRTAKARKGTAWNHVFSILRRVDEEWARNCVSGGLSTGEGLIWAVRDPIHERSPIRGEKSRIVGYQDIEGDPGVADKRLLTFESEWARVLTASERNSNTLTEVLRQASDGETLRILTKKQAPQATDTHISVVAHITKDELRKRLVDTAKSNGFANRHLFICARRSKLLPEGGNLDKVDFSNVIERLQRAANFSRTLGEMKRDDEATAIWREVYPALSEAKPGMFGSITARSEMLAVRLHDIYAQLDGSPLVKAVHLKAALAVVKYGEASARFIWGDSIGDDTADEILRQLRARPDGMTRTEIRDLFQRNRSGEEIGRALGVLQENGLARVERERESEDSIKPTERWFAITVSSSTEVRH